MQISPKQAYARIFTPNEQLAESLFRPVINSRSVNGARISANIATITPLEHCAPPEIVLKSLQRSPRMIRDAFGDPYKVLLSTYRRYLEAGNIEEVISFFKNLPENVLRKASETITQMVKISLF